MKGTGSNPGLGQLAFGPSLSTQQYVGTFFKSGKDKGKGEGDGLHLSYVVIQ